LFLLPTERTYDYGEAVEGVIGIAAPVRNHLRKVVAAVGTAFPAFSANDQKVNPVRNSSGALNPALRGGTPYGAEPGIILKSNLGGLLFEKISPNRTT